ncbi:MAG: hypothetical protein MUP98_19790 [Candidatus Aminicenantes bacterium]|nr:hypothetical protein [Candidatus Aminicenantes bacterium]
MEIANNIAVKGAAFSSIRSRPTKTLDYLNRGPSTVNITKSNKGSACGSEEICPGRFGVDRLEAIYSRLNSVARTIRVADENMGTIENFIDRMETESQRIVKNYPPFPPGSEERVKRLKSIAAFRRLIDQLTIPPPNEEFTANTVPDHDVVSKTNNSQKMISELKLHQTEPEGLDIPQLPEGADDEALHAFIEKLGAAREMLRQMRSELVADASKIAESYEGETEVAGIYPSYGEEIKSADMEAEAELRSSDLSFALTVEPGMTLTEAQSQLLSLLN